MALTNWTRRGSWLAPAVVVVLLPLVAVAAERHRKLKAGEYNPANDTIELFAAIRSGDIEVKLIPKDATQSRVRITNKTDRPLNVKLPDAFAGVPVLAQAFGGGGGGLGGGGGRRDRSGGGGGNQGMGGGMGGMMGGMMNVKPEVVADFKVPTVCLEHGKKDPRPEVPYEIKPINEFTDKAEVHELCRMLGAGQLDQRAAQAAAWHFSNDMTWQELAAKELRSAGRSYPYFTAAEIHQATQIASAAIRAAKEKEREQKTADKNDSLANQPVK